MRQSWCQIVHWNTQLIEIDVRSVSSHDKASSDQLLYDIEKKNRKIRFTQLVALWTIVKKKCLVSFVGRLPRKLLTEAETMSLSFHTVLLLLLFMPEVTYYCCVAYSA